jgi:sulfur carrier protein
VVVTVNGKPTELASGATVATVVELLGAAPGGRGIAVAVAGEVVPRRAWSDTGLTDGLEIEVVTAVQGG